MKALNDRKLIYLYLFGDFRGLRQESVTSLEECGLITRDDKLTDKGLVVASEILQKALEEVGWKSE